MQSDSAAPNATYAYGSAMAFTLATATP